MILIIDGNNLAHRCKYVFSLSTGGLDVSVTYGFLRVMYSLMKKYSPTSVVVCWDGGIPEFRIDTLPSYKASRKRDWDELEVEDFNRQMNELDHMLPHMGVISIRRIGSEADDLMYHAAKVLDDDEIIIVTSDKDLFQVLRYDNVRVLNPARDALYDRAMIEEEIGTEILNYVYWRALQGDSSDGIAGVPGIGEKTATKLFKEHKNSSKIFYDAELGRIGGKLEERIKEFGTEQFCKSTYVMHLHQDRTGAIISIIEAVHDHVRANPKKVKRYFLQNAFTSFIGTSFVRDLSNLEAPKIKEGTRSPVAIGRRTPVT